jgi:DNA topoisomerase-3
MLSDAQMQFIPLRPVRLYCQTCEETYSLPQQGAIKLYKEITCPLDGFELVLWSLGSGSKTQIGNTQRLLFLSAC